MLFFFTDWKFFGKKSAFYMPYCFMEESINAEKKA